MPSVVPNLRLLDQVGTSREWDLVSELFHRINRIIPADQKVLTVPPSCSVRDAIAQMREHGYSQVPVVDHSTVLGVFSFRSFAVNAAKASLSDWTQQRCAPGDLRVDEFLEEFQFARVTEEMSRVFDSLDRDNAVLIGTPERLIGILTPMDFLRYLYQVASPFVMVSEIELALRALIRTTQDPEQIAALARRCFAALFKSPDDIPLTLEDMTFDNYVMLIAHSESWPLFEPIFGGTRARTNGKLREVCDLRNALFHFKREMTLVDHQTLADHRNWLLAKMKQIGGPRA